MAKGKVGKAAEEASSWFGKVCRRTKRKIEDAGTKFGQGVSDLGDKLAGGVERLEKKGNKLVNRHVLGKEDTVEDKLEDMWDKFAKAMDNLGKWISRKFDSFCKWCERVTEDAGKYLRKLDKKAEKWAERQGFNSETHKQR